MADRGVDLAALPKEVREHLAELELELSEGDITQKGYEKKRVKLLAPFVPQTQNVDVSIQLTPGLSSDPTSTPNAVPVAAPRQHRAHRSGGTRDDRYRSDIHTEAVQAALARHKEAKMALPMPTKRRSAFVQSPAENCTPPGWSHFAHKPSAAPSVQISLTSRVSENTGTPEPLWHTLATYIYSVPPDITSSVPQDRNSRVDMPPNIAVRGMSRGQSRSSMMDTAGGVPAHSRVSTKIQQLLNTLKRPKRPPLSEFFLDDSEEIVEVPQPDPNTPRPEGRQIIPVKGEPLGVVSNWPPALQAALARWGATQAKSPALTALDITGKPLYTLTYGKLWSRSLKLAYTLLNKLGTKNEPVLKPGDRVALVYPNSDPGMFWVAFYGCLLAEVIPVPIEVPLSRKDAGSQQIGFLLGSCGVGLALTSEVCLKGLPKTQNGEIMQFKGWPRLKWVVTDTKYLTKPSKDWQPHIPTANTDTAYIEVSAGRRAHVLSKCLSCICVCTARVALVKCRDLHWAMLAHRDQKDTNLSSLRMLIVADGANPWSVSSCDAFLNVFQSHGLKPEMICPCASSPEAMTVAIRRYLAPLPARAILSMAGLSHGVIRVNTEDKNSALTVQDVGHVMPGALMCIVKPDGLPMLCKTDEIGEIVLNSRAGGTMYYGLPGVTKSTFELIPVNSGGTPIGDVPFTRTGLLGFVGPGSLVFVVGKIEGLLSVSGRRHNADDLVATALAVEPVKTVYRGRIAVFSVTVFYDERIVIVAEQRPDANEEDSFQWMSRVLQAIDGIHQVGLYCLALVPANTLPKTPLGGIHLSETKHHFLEGSLHPCNVLMCPHTCVTNLPKPRQKQTVGPASIMVGNLVAGKRIAQASGRDLRLIDDQEQSKKVNLSSSVLQHQFLSEALQWRAQTDPDHVLYMLLNAKGVAVSTATCSQLHKRAEKITAALLERGGINTGDNVVLLYPPGIDLIASFYGCLYAGCIPVTVRPPHPQNLAATLPTVRMIIDVSKASCILTTQTLMKILRSKEAAASVNVKTWPNIIDTDDLPKKRPSHIYKPPTAEMLAYLDFSVSTTGMLTGVKISHSAVNALCRSIKLQCELYSSRQIAICMDPYCGLGFVLWCMSSVYSGHQSILIPPMELETSLPLWLSTLSQYKIRDTFCSYSVMELCTKGLGTQTEARGVNLSCVRSCVVIAEERPRLALTQSFSKLFKDLGLSPRAVSTAFGARVNLAICLQCHDARAGPVHCLCRHERGAPQSLPLTESGTILPGVRVIIVNPETRGPLGDSHLGEIWVSSPHNASGYYTIYGEESLQADHFNTRLSFGDTETLWARTGYLGFVTRTELLDASGDRHNALFVVGSLDETLELRGLRYHPIDIETSVSRAHRSIAESAVFTWTNLLVVVVELSGSEQEALDLVPLVTNVVLKEHHLIVGVVVIVDPGVIPINSRGEKQRMHLRDSFLADQLDPIYVAYNM
uniref:Disco-interacting protein 2 homolog Ba n=1 Tax=Cyprinus carpio TaxID=7962 RepID=A0A8C2FK50_CYPCA